MALNPYLAHVVGGVAGSVLGETAHPTPFVMANVATLTASGSSYVSFSIKQAMSAPFIADLRGGGNPLPLLAAITASPSPQDVQISSTLFFDQTGDNYILIGYGTANVEIAKVKVVDATHVNGIFLNSHSDPATSVEYIKLIYASLSAYLSFYYQGSGFSLTNIGFIRALTQSNNDVYDFCRVLGATGSIAYDPDGYLPWWSGGSIANAAAAVPVPLYDPALVTATGSPTNMIQLEPGPVTTVTSLPNVQVLKVYTNWPGMDSAFDDYRFWCDVG
jgi:hypothetical protein